MYVSICLFLFFLFFLFYKFNGESLTSLIWRNKILTSSLIITGNSRVMMKWACEETRECESGFWQGKNERALFVPCRPLTLKEWWYLTLLRRSKDATSYFSILHKIYTFSLTFLDNDKPFRNHVSLTEIILKDKAGKQVKEYCAITVQSNISERGMKPLLTLWWILKVTFSCRTVSVFV